MDMQKGTGLARLRGGNLKGACKEAMSNNYIKIDRKILEWEWYKNLNTCRLFFHILLKANWRDGKFEGKTIPRGSFVSSITALSQETGLTQKEVRTAINHLKTTGELASRSCNKYTVFTVNNYCLYQDEGKQGGKQAAGNGQTNGKLRATIEERKEGKKEKREEDNITVSNETVCQTDVRRIIAAWNSLQQYGIRPVSKLSSSSKRYQMLIARVKQYSVANVIAAVERIKSSQFLQGKNNKGWTINFDWFVLPNNFPKVLEGNYDDVADNRKRNDFIDFKQNDYDFSALEQELLSN